MHYPETGSSRELSPYRYLLAVCLAMSCLLMTKTVNADAFLTAIPSSVNFGQVAVGSDTTQSVTIFNNGNMSARIIGTPASSPFSGFLFDMTVPAFGSSRLFITFSPFTEGNFNGVVQVIYDPGSGVSRSLFVSVSGSTKDDDPPDVLLPPSSVSASDGTFPNQIRVQWSAVSGASSYDVYRNTDSNPLAATRIATGVTGTVHGDFSAAKDVLYYYWVRSVSPFATSFFSVGDTGFRQGSVLTMVVTPEVDAHIQQERPNDNFGGVPLLRIRDVASGFGRHAFLRFDVPAINGTIESAALRLRPLADIPTVSVFDVNMNWTEFGINWNNWLDGGTTFEFLRAIGFHSAGQWVSLNVTETVSASGGLVNLGLATSSNLGGLRYHSRESSSSPELVIRYRP